MCVVSQYQTIGDPANHLGASKCKAVAETAARTSANKATPLTFLKRRRLSGNSALLLFSSVGKQTKDTVRHFLTWRELFKTLKWIPRAMLDYLIAPHQLCCIHNIAKAAPT